MLILTRKKGEEIVIGDDIVVQIIAKNGAQIRLGISAPKGTSILRREVWKQIQEEKKENAE